MSKSDPIAIVFTYDPAKQLWYEVGQTEYIMDNLSPNWLTKIQVEHFLNDEQKLRIEVFNYDCKEKTFSKHDFLGSSEVMLQDILDGENSSIELKLIDKRTSRLPMLTITAELDNNAGKRYNGIFQGSKTISTK